MKRIIRLTEGDLRRIVKRSANRILREFGSDGPDFDEPYGTSNMFQNIGMDGQHADSASDIDDFNPDDMGIYDGNESDEDDGMDFDDEALDFYGGDSVSDGYYNEYDDDNQPDMIMPESRKRMSRIIKESVRKVLREVNDKDFPSFNNRFETVPANVARRYGFKPEYKMENGTEIWGRYLNPQELESSGELLIKLGIKSWASHNINGHVRIYVAIPEKGSWRPNEWSRPQKKIGDYVNTEWADKDGAIFHNPKNGHIKRF